MRSITKAALASVAFTVLPLRTASAQEVLNGVAKAVQDSGVTTASLVEIVTSIVRTVLSFTGLLLVIIFMYAGFLWMTAGGNQERVDQAKATIRNAIIGIIIVLMSYSGADFIINAVLTATGAK